MITMTTLGVTRPTCLGGGLVSRERYTFGPGAFVAPVQMKLEGTGVSAVSFIDPSVENTPAAVKDGAVSGLRPWSQHPV
ncbi:MAG: hypothetical protein GEV10_16535 [Streptosporangiales bacterium]|nr:hypothetical protein [Streptosporangiales bacterium]